jgi:predicted enzyme related to lactoylglutathione lyase
MQKQSTAHGALSWVTLASQDVPAAASFYRALLGWQTIGDETYLLASRDGVPVGALHPGAGGTSGWLPHLGVPSVTKAIDDVVRAGGASVTSPEADGTGAIVAIVTDPAGVRSLSASHPRPRRWISRSRPGCLRGVS